MSNRFCLITCLLHTSYSPICRDNIFHLFIGLFTFQTTFFIKRDSESLTDEEMPDFLQALQQLGMTLETYNGAYNNNTHPHALECTRQFNECEGLQQESPPAKRAKVGEGTSATPAE